MRWRLSIGVLLLLAGCAGGGSGPAHPRRARISIVRRSSAPAPDSGPSLARHVGDSVLRSAPLNAVVLAHRFVRAYGRWDAGNRGARVRAELARVCSREVVSELERAGIARRSAPSGGRLILTSVGVSAGSVRASIGYRQGRRSPPTVLYAQEQRTHGWRVTRLSR